MQPAPFKRVCAVVLSLQLLRPSAVSFPAPCAHTGAWHGIDLRACVRPIPALSPRSHHLPSCNKIIWPHPGLDIACIFAVTRIISILHSPQNAPSDPTTAAARVKMPRHVNVDASVLRWPRMCTLVRVHSLRCIPRVADVLHYTGSAHTCYTARAHPPLHYTPTPLHPIPTPSIPLYTVVALPDPEHIPPSLPHPSPTTCPDPTQRVVLYISTVPRNTLFGAFLPFLLCRDFLSLPSLVDALPYRIYTTSLVP